MTTEAIVDLTVEALEDLKATRIQVLDVRGKTDVTDFMVVASGRSTRQVKAAAEHVIEKAKASGLKPMGVEGLSDPEWVLVDLCDVVVHVMIPEARELYQLEKLWAGAEKARREREEAAN